MNLNEYLSIDTSNGVPILLAHWMRSYRSEAAEIQNHMANKARQEAANTP